MNEKWYALSVKPHKERAVYQLLQSQTVQTFFPVIRVKPVNPRSAKERPYFPGYMFVRADLTALGHNAFSWVMGTKGLVAFGGEAAVVPDTLIDELQERLANLTAAAPAQSQLQKGDRVRIVDGPFAGFEAIFDLHLSGSDRVQVLLAFLNNHLQRIKLEADHVKKVD